MDAEDALEDRELGFGAVVGLVLRELLFRAVGRVLCALRLTAVAVRLQASWRHMASWVREAAMSRSVGPSSNR